MQGLPGNVGCLEDDETASRTKNSKRLIEREAAVAYFETQRL